jgi:hypothetical protein
MYSKRSGLILGFHGCDKSVLDKVVNGKDVLQKSMNDYDWLGHGIYFWENDNERALEYAKTLSKNKKNLHQAVYEPAVIGAVIDIGYCLDLLNSNYLKLLKISYDLLIEYHNKYGSSIPKNKSIDGGKELLIRKLDCAVIENLHQFYKETKKHEFDTVKGVFWEGSFLYPEAGFREKNHIQICVRNPNCIKGYFLPQELDNNYIIP